MTVNLPTRNAGDPMVIYRLLSRDGDLVPSNSRESSIHEGERQMLAPQTLLHDRYLILNPLGQGGMGAVYHATDRKFGSQVAIKETYLSDPRFRVAFSQEAKLLNRLRHAALPMVMDFFDEGERQFLVMQYIPGMDLEQCLNERKRNGRGRFHPVEVLPWANQLLGALEYLHSQNPPIIHRDIKPQNLKLTPRGEIVLLDFGLAKGAPSPHSHSSRSLRGYTPHYASIEQIRGAGTDARSDIYSVGATLYHLLTGEMPPDALTRIAALLMGQPDPLPSVMERSAEVSENIAMVIDRALSPHPDQRFESAASMRQALFDAASQPNRFVSPRTPTLIDDPLFSKIEAALSVAIKHDSNGHNSHEGERSMVAEIAAEPARPRAASRPTPVTQSPSRSRIWVPLAMVFCILLIVAGILLVRFQRWGNGLIADINKLAIRTEANVSGTVWAIPMRIEAMRYFLELAPGLDADPQDAGLRPLGADSRFKFHFIPRERGYLYIVALVTGDRWQTILTNHPMPASGVVTNYLEAGNKYQFPDGGQWLLMHRRAESTPFTVIFSPRPLADPVFLSQVAGHQLTEAEEKELADFRKAHAVQDIELVAVSDRQQPAVTVQVTPDCPEEAILIFDISLKKRAGG